MGLKFPNLIMNVYSKEHAKSILNVAEKLGWDVLGKFDVVDIMHPAPCALHLKPCGEVFIYGFMTAQALIDGGQPRVLYEDAVLVNSRRRIKSLTHRLRSTESIDRDSTLEVKVKTDTSTYPVMWGDQYSSSHEDSFNNRDAHKRIGFLHLNDPQTTHTPVPIICHCDVTVKQRKECIIKQCYGGTKCKPIKWERPKAENSIVNLVVATAVLAFDNIVQGVKRFGRMLRGGF